MSEQIEIEERELVVSATAMLRDAYWFGGSAALATTFGGFTQSFAVVCYRVAPMNAARPFGLAERIRMGSARMPSGQGHSRDVPALPITF